MLEKFEQHGNQEYAMSLICSKNPALLMKLLYMSIDNSTALHKQTYFSRFLYSLLEKPEARLVVYEFAKNSLLTNQTSPRIFADVVAFLSHEVERPADLNNVSYD